VGSMRGGWPPQQEPGGRLQGRSGDGVRFKSHRPLQYFPEVTITFLGSALQEIPQEQRQALELSFFGGLTHEQIAERLATPLGTIKARIRRGLLRLRDCLKEGL